MTLTKSIASLAMLLATAVNAQVVGVDIGSAHLHGGMNNVNPGVYARLDSGFTLGAFYNSEQRMSAYAGWTFHDQDDRFAVTLGAITGYKRAVILPMVVPSVRFGLTGQTSLRLSLGLAANPALHLSIERKF